VVRVAVVAVALLALAGCTTTPSPDHTQYPYPYTSALIDESRASANAPAEFRDRTTLPACDDVLLRQGDEIPDAAIACVEDAGPDGAELAVGRPTTEGDAYVSFYRVGPGIDGIEIWEDGTRDAFGGGWHLGTCRDVSVLAPGRCAYQDF
jgi:hypothetical protein